MASLEELAKDLPAKYTLSNKNIIFIAHVRDETIYFFDYLDPFTTIVLLSSPDCIELKAIFLNFMNDFGVTVIDLNEPEIFDPSYILSPKSAHIIKTILKNNNFTRIITHPQYPKENDPQNRALYDIVRSTLIEQKINNHYVYALGQFQQRTMSKKKIHLLNLYSRLCQPNYTQNIDVMKRYLEITSKISGIRIISNYNKKDEN